MVLTPIIALIAVAVCRSWVGIATITTMVAEDFAAVAQDLVADG